MGFEAQAPYPYPNQIWSKFKKKIKEKKKKKKKERKKDKKMSRLWSLRDLTFLYPGQETTKHGYTTRLLL